MTLSEVLSQLRSTTADVYYVVFILPATGQRIQHGPFIWNTAQGELTRLTIAGIEAQIHSALDIEIT